jgi:hypothetical protein
MRGSLREWESDKRASEKKRERKTEMERRRKEKN